MYSIDSITKTFEKIYHMLKQRKQGDDSRK